MNPVTKETTLGFYDDCGVATIIAKREDTERIIVFSLVDDLSDYVVRDSSYIYFRECFSNDFILPPVLLDKNEVLSEDGTKLTLNLTSDMLAISGVARCDLVFIDCEEEPEFNDKGELVSYDAKVLSTQTFKLYIAPSVYEGDNHKALDQKYIDLIMPMVIKFEHIVEHDEEYTANENIRKANETDRQAAETTRSENETQRQTNETARQTAETNRSSAEASRVTAENTRVDNEISRADAESARVSAETARATAETARNNAETTRVSQESSRVSAEEARVTAETTRASSEADRVTAEQNRVSAETARADAEATRVSQETSRQTAETARDTAEATRVSNETSRQDSENERDRAELEREAKEGKGNYSDPQDLDYIDEDGETVTVPYQSSRVGLTERLLAIADGGSFVDASGNVQTMENEYEDLDGNIVEVDDEDLGGMSALATIVYARYLASEAAEGIESAIAAADNASASADDAAQYAQEAKDARDSTIDASAQARIAIEAANEAKASADAAEEALADVTDKIDNLNDRIDIQIDGQGHLIWNIN